MNMHAFESLVDPIQVTRIKAAETADPDGGALSSTEVEVTK